MVKSVECITVLCTAVKSTYSMYEKLKSCWCDEAMFTRERALQYGPFSG